MGQEIKGMIDIKLIPHDSWNPSRIKRGPIKLPDGVSVEGELIVVGENDEYLHCFISGTGMYYGVFKSHEEDHLYRHFLRLNT